MPNPEDRSDAEIEVTPEMIEAGLYALEYWSDLAGNQAIVEAVYIAMACENSKRDRSACHQAGLDRDSTKHKF